MKPKCIYNKSALKHFKKAVCYYCLSSFDVSDVDTSEEGELLKCPECGYESVIPIVNDDDLTLNWVADVALYYFNLEEE